MQIYIELCGINYLAVHCLLYCQVRFITCAPRKLRGATNVPTKARLLCTVTVNRGYRVMPDPHETAARGQRHEPMNKGVTGVLPVLYQ